MTIHYPSVMLHTTGTHTLVTDHQHWPNDRFI